MAGRAGDIERENTIYLADQAQVAIRHLPSVAAPEPSALAAAAAEAELAALVPPAGTA